MRIDLIEINAFIKKGKNTSGSPAGVCLLSEFPADAIMQGIATQNNLPETAFLVPEDEKFHIRWFSPTQEVALCGHATLAAAHALFKHLKPGLQVVEFTSLSGILKASRRDELIELDFPARSFEKISTPSLILEAIPFSPQEVLASDDYIVVLKNEQQIADLAPHLDKLAQLDRRGVIFTAPGNQVDFVSRVFHPKLGIDEDPACGSAHCELMPYWSKRLDNNTLHACQLASRPAEFFCRIEGDRVFLQGGCYAYFNGPRDYDLPKRISL